MSKFFATLLPFVIFFVGGCGAPTVRYHAERYRGGDTTPENGVSTSTNFKTGVEHSRRFYAEKREVLGTHVYQETHLSRPIKGGPVVKSTISRSEEVRYNYGTPLPVTGVRGREFPFSLRRIFGGDERED